MQQPGFFNRLSALKALFQSLLQAEDIIKVHEARLTEKETSSLDLREVANYRDALKVCFHFICTFILYNCYKSNSNKVMHICFW